MLCSSFSASCRYTMLGSMAEVQLKLHCSQLLTETSFRVSRDSLRLSGCPLRPLAPMNTVRLCYSQQLERKSSWSLWSLWLRKELQVFFGDLSTPHCRAFVDLSQLPLDMGCSYVGLASLDSTSRIMTWNHQSEREALSTSELILSHEVLRVGCLSRCE